MELADAAILCPESGATDDASAMAVFSNTMPYLGMFTSFVDPTEGNSVAENASILNGPLCGSASTSLCAARADISFATEIGGATSSPDLDHSYSNDTVAAVIQRRGSTGSTSPFVQIRV